MLACCLTQPGFPFGMSANIFQTRRVVKLFAIAIVMTLLGGCAGRESDDIVKLRLTQEFAKDERTFHECADWARESLGEDASGAEQMELTNSCLHMQTDLKDREADIKEKEEELESAKRELEEARRKIEDARRKREAERERELEETKWELEEEKRKREDAEQARAQTNIPQSPTGHSDESRIYVAEALLLFKQGQYAKALPLAKKGVRLVEREKGLTHSDTAIALVLLAFVYFELGDYSSASPRIGDTRGDISQRQFRSGAFIEFLGVGACQYGRLFIGTAFASPCAGDRREGRG